MEHVTAERPACRGTDEGDAMSHQLRLHSSHDRVTCVYLIKTTNTTPAFSSFTHEPRASVLAG